jgi:hypothetical protein
VKWIVEEMEEKGDLDMSLMDVSSEHLLAAEDVIPSSFSTNGGAIDRYAIVKPCPRLHVLSCTIMCLGEEIYPSGGFKIG